ncbi:hypothetical protein HK101_002652 [Irineochytrium annulatum]|nr:hypothetical protein HK101_002652 [Irineochytrium annulatum]
MRFSFILAAVAAFAAAAVNAKVQFAGLNEAGLEFGLGINGPDGGAIPGSQGVNFFAPNPAAMKHAMDSFANIFRIPFAWERIQPSANGGLNAAYLALVDGAVQTANAQGAVALLDVHNYARYNSQVLGSQIPGSYLNSLWSQLATKYASNPNVWFGLMNEPHGIDTQTWFGVAQGTINAIRATGAGNKIVVPGNCFTGAHSWVSGYCDPGISNAQAALAITDPKNNYIFDMHQYLDTDFSGTHTDCVQNGPAVMADATNWLRAHGKQALLGEFGVAANQNCLSSMDQTLTYLDSNSDVWVGYTFWAAGSAWGDYIYTVESTSTSQDHPQQAILNKHPGAGKAPTSAPVTPTSTTTTSTSSTPSSGCAPIWAQCGGIGFSGPTCCQAGTTCQFSNAWYSQCLPASKRR